MTATDFRRAQLRRHRADIASGDTDRSSPDRLKARALELGALVGRWAVSGAAFPDPDTRDAVLSATAGAANLLRIRLHEAAPAPDGLVPDWPALAQAVGGLADAAEKIDHLEDFRPVADAATLALARWCRAAPHALPACLPPG